MRDRKRFPGLVERLVKDWLIFLERPVAASGVEPERVSPLATFILATIQGLQLDLLATGERTRIDRAFREMRRLLAMPRAQVGDRQLKGARVSSMHDSQRMREPGD